MRLPLVSLPRSFILVVFGAVCASAQSPQPLSLASAIEMARSTHPLLQSSSNRVAAARSGVTQAGLRPNPRLYLQSENWRSWSGLGMTASEQTDTFAYFSQPIETGGKRALRTAFAQASLRRSELERELTDRQIVARVKQAYWNAEGAARIHQAVLEDVDNFRQIIDYHEKRVREGAMPEADLLKVQLEGERLRLSANAAGLEAERARIELFRAMGQTEFPEVRFTGNEPPPPIPPVGDLDIALTERAEMKIARQAREEAAANASLQRALAKPDMDFVFGYKRTLGVPTVIGGMQYNLPFLNRNQGAISSADATIKVAESDIAATEAAVRAELRTAIADVAIRRTQVFETLPKLRAQADESAKIALAAYQEGGADLLRLLDAQRVRIEVETLYYRTVSEYRQSIAALETAMGGDR